MDVSDLIAAVEREANLAGAAAARGPWDAPVPTCPGWTVGNLVRHLGYVHRWATRHVADALTEMGATATEAEILADGPPDDELGAWFAEGAGALVTALATAPPDLRCWTFMRTSSPLLFWARRQAHETTVHRIDLESAVPPVGGVDTALAADGLDELLSGFLHLERPRVAGHAHYTLAVQSTDTADAWVVRERGDRLVAERGAGPAACSASGRAAALYRLLWNRGEPDALGVTVRGDAALLAAWRDGVRVHWT